MRQLEAAGLGELEAHDAARGFPEPTATLDPRDPPEAAASRVGQRYGPYEIVRHLGTGGMGSVYLARRADGQFEQDLAIKVMNRGMGSDVILRRFRAERQILAGLDHPNVCRLFDGGASDDGVPYFVMEHIDGEPIDSYCQWHGLSVPQRLELFLAVCDAVRCAHQNLVVHCDIKPRNILVTTGGTVKLLDFGIAKLLGRSGAGTHSQFMTPWYASPEQVRGDPVSTATDVHAMGILLYELLVGHNPFARGERTGSELARAIVEEEPAPPSQVAEAPRLRRALRGDLDSIVLRALSKDPGRRYPSASELAADVERHLRGQPVLARPDAVRYRAAKFIRRHRLGVSAAAAVLISLIVGFATIAWQARIATRERARAERRFEDVRRMANTLVFDLHDAIQDLAGSTSARKLLVERALTLLDALAADAVGDVALQRELGEAYLKLGDVQGRPGRSNLGGLGDARASYEKGLAIVEAVLARNPRDVQARRLHSRLLRFLGRVIRPTGDAEGALGYARRALAEQQDLLAERPGDVHARGEIAGLKSDLGDVLEDLGRNREAAASYRESLAAYRALAEGNRLDLRIRRSLAIVIVRVGDTLLAEGDDTGALELYREALDIREASVASEPDSAQARRALSLNLYKIGDALFKTGDATAALAYYERALEMNRGLAAADRQDARALRDLAVTLRRVGEVRFRLAGAAETVEGSRPIYREAGTRFREALAVYNDMKARDQLRPSDAATLTEIGARIATCDDNGR